MNPAYSYLTDVVEQLNDILPSEFNAKGRCFIWAKLEDLDGDMDMNKVKATMRDKEKRAKVAAVLRDYAERIDRAVLILDKER